MSKETTVKVLLAVLTVLGAVFAAFIPVYFQLEDRGYVEYTYSMSGISIDLAKEISGVNGNHIASGSLYEIEIRNESENTVKNIEIIIDKIKLYSACALGGCISGKNIDATDRLSVGRLAPKSKLDVNIYSESYNYGGEIVVLQDGRVASGGINLRPYLNIFGVGEFFLKNNLASIMVFSVLVTSLIVILIVFLSFILGVVKNTAVGTSDASINSTGGGSISKLNSDHEQKPEMLSENDSKDG